MRISDWSSDVCSSDLPEEVAAAYGGARSFGPEYIIPAPFDPRLIDEIPLAVARAAMATGVARKPILDAAAYQTELPDRLNPTTTLLTSANEPPRENPTRVIFDETQPDIQLRAPTAFRAGAEATPRVGA